MRRWHVIHLYRLNRRHLSEDGVQGLCRFLRDVLFQRHWYCVSFWTDLIMQAQAQVRCLSLFKLLPHNCMIHIGFNFEILLQITAKYDLTELQLIHCHFFDGYLHLGCLKRYGLYGHRSQVSVVLLPLMLLLSLELEQFLLRQGVK